MKTKIKLFLLATGWCFFGMLTMEYVYFLIPALIFGFIFGVKMGGLDL